MKYIALLYGDPQVDAGPAPGTAEFMQMLSVFGNQRPPLQSGLNRWGPGVYPAG